MEEDERNAGKTVTLPVDIGESHFAQTEIIKEGDFLTCAATMIANKVKPDGKDGDTMYSIKKPMVIPNTLLGIITGGGKQAPAVFNTICFQGSVFRISDLRETNNGKKMIFVTIGFSPKMDKNASEDEKKDARVYLDAAFFGGTAENYIAKYLHERDVCLVTGSLALKEENWTVQGKKPMNVQIQARDAKFVTPVDKDGGGRRPSDKPNKSGYGQKTGVDDDLAY